MPFLLPHRDSQNQILFIGQCRNADPTIARYVVISIRGYFTFNEALPFLQHSKIRGVVPYYGDYFANTVYLPSRMMDVHLPMDDDKHKKIKYYIYDYATPRLLSQYEWNIARHDVHQFVEPEDRSQRVFGDYLTPAEQIQAIRDNDLLQVIRTIDRDYPFA